jgi:murein DD-endopeptidase MepM/ murein hydrolase activator NlpD
MFENLACFVHLRKPLMNKFRKIVLQLVLVTLFLSLNILSGEADANNSGIKLELNSILDDAIAVAFSLPTEELDFAVINMCTGQMLSDCVVSSEFGWRKHPKWKRKHFHSGIDLKANRGNFVFAPADGIVKSAGRNRGYGRVIDLGHAFTVQTRYAHLRKIYVHSGQKIKKGDIIGEVGSSGVSTGPHLHFEMFYFNQKVDPRKYFTKLNHFGTFITSLANI